MTGSDHSCSPASPRAMSPFGMFAVSRCLRVNAQTESRNAPMVIEPSAVPQERMLRRCKYLGIAALRRLLHLHGEMGQRLEPRQSRLVIIRVAALGGPDRKDRAEMARAEPPQMQVGERIALALDDLAQARLQVAIRRHVEQDRAGVADEAVRPTRDDEGADHADERIDPQPIESAGEDKPGNDQDGDRGVGEDMDQSRAHIVVARRRANRMAMFLENEATLRAGDAQMGGEFVRLGNFVDRFEKAAAIGEKKGLARAVRPHGFDRDGLRRRQGRRRGAQAEARRRAVFEDFERRRLGPGGGVAFLALVPGMRIRMAMSMAMRMAAAEYEDAGDIHRQAEASDRNGFGEV